MWNLCKCNCWLIIDVILRNARCNSKVYCKREFIGLGNVYRALVFRASFLFFAARSHRCLKTLFFTAIKCVSMVFKPHCASFYRLSLLRCHLSHSRRLRDSATSAVILRLDLAILACQFPSHIHSLVRVLKKIRSVLPVSSLSVYFQFVHLLLQVTRYMTVATSALDVLLS